MQISHVSLLWNYLLRKYTVVTFLTLSFTSADHGAHVLEFEMAHKIVPKCLTLFKRQGKERAQDLIWPCYYVITSNTRPSSKKQGNQLITSGRGRCRQSPPSVSRKIWPNTPSSTGVTCLWLHWVQRVKVQRLCCLALPCLVAFPPSPRFLNDQKAIRKGW